MSILKTTIDSNTLTTKIGLEIHVQLKTLSKMFCRCDNQSFVETTDGKQIEGKAPNTVVCPVCLALPGALPVANLQAILWTIKTGLALNCKIAKVSKFDRKHYFYPDLPKGYQISQYDQPFCLEGELEVLGHKVRFNRIHLEEDAGKLIHSNGSSLVDLNRAGTPLMEIVTEPDIASPKEAGDFLRKLQKIVRDVVQVSEASMEKGHLRCDANISISDEAGRMSKIVEIKNLNSFRFVEKALLIEEEKLKAEYPDWPEKKIKATHGYDSVKNITYVQREKEEAADYRYFPEPDLPPFDLAKFNIEELKGGIGRSELEVIESLISIGISEGDAKTLANDKFKLRIFEAISGNKLTWAKVLVHNYFGFSLSETELEKLAEYEKAVVALESNQISKPILSKVAENIRKGSDFDSALAKVGGIVGSDDEITEIVKSVLSENPAEVQSYREGKSQLLGFFMGQVMRKTGGKADARIVNKILIERLEDK